MIFIWFFKIMLTFFSENLKMQNFDKNPEIRKIYWMNHVIETYVLTATKAFKCMNQIRKYYILVFKNMLTFFHENLKMQNFDENPEIRKLY